MEFIPAFSMCQTFDPTVRALREVTENRTVRMRMRVNVSGDAVRLHFENTDPAQAGRIDKMTLARCAQDGALLPQTAVPVTVSGEDKLTLAPGVRVQSDVLPFAVSAGEWIALSVYCREPQASGNHILPFTTQSAAGEHCNEEFDDHDQTPADMGSIGARIGARMPLFTLLEVRSAQTPHIAVCFGDSITQQGYWYAALQKRLYDAYPQKICLLNAGIGGNRLCKRTNGVACCSGSEAGLVRMERDVFAVRGITHMIFALGINDLMHGGASDPEPSPTGERFLEACRRVADCARAQGVKTMAFTVCPAKLSADAARAAMLEPLYHDYNEAIRKAGFDCVLETEPFMRAGKAQHYIDGISVADGLHLNAEGGKLVANAVDIAWFL